MQGDVCFIIFTINLAAFMEMLVIVKKVLVMAVNPGNAGQMFLPYVCKNVSDCCG